MGIFLGLYAQAQPAGPGLASRWTVEPGLQQQTEEVFTAAIHPASAASLPNWAVGIRAARFSWEGSPLVAGLYAVIPIHTGGISLGWATQGIHGYRSWHAHGGYALRVAEWAQIGVRIGYQRQVATGYAVAARWQADAGVVLRLTERLQADLACWNLAGWSSSSPGGVPASRLFRSGITWLSSGKTGISLSVSGGEGLPAAVQGTVWYRIDASLQARLIYTTVHQGIAVGVEYQTGRFRASIIFGYMFPLGMLGMPSVQFNGNTAE